MKNYVFKQEFLEDKDNYDNCTERKTENNICFTLIQTAICIILVVIAILFKSVAPDTYLRFKNHYDSVINTEDISFGDVKAFAFTVFDFIFTDKKGSGGEDIQKTNDTSLSAYVLTTEIVPPTKGVVTSEFGYRIHPIYKTEGFHTGVDIASSLGTEVVASFSGKIDEVGKSAAYGNYVIMKHSDTLYTFYGHCDSVKADEGMYMRKGEIIAYMGSTGYSTGPHLHFEIRICGKKVDPLYVLKGFEDIAV